MSRVSSPIAATRAVTLALVASAIIYFLLAMAVSCTRTPLDDDAFYASAPYNLYAHGFTGTTIYEPTILPAPGMVKRTYAYPPLYIVVQAAWFKLAGSGIFQMRLHSTLWGFLFLGGRY